MALVLNERVKETTTTTGTGALSLGGAPTGFETFAAGIGNSNTTYYAIFHATADEFEVGNIHGNLFISGEQANKIHVAELSLTEFSKNVAKFYKKYVIK